MFQRGGVVLEGGMQVGKGRMPRVAGLGKQAEIGQPQVPDIEAPQTGRFDAAASGKPGMGKHQQKTAEQNTQQQEIPVSTPHYLITGSQAP